MPACGIGLLEAGAAGGCGWRDWRAADVAVGNEAPHRVRASRTRASPGRCVGAGVGLRAAQSRASAERAVCAPRAGPGSSAPRARAQPRIVRARDACLNATRVYAGAMHLHGCAPLRARAGRVRPGAQNICWRHRAWTRSVSWPPRGSRGWISRRPTATRHATAARLVFPAALWYGFSIWRRLCTSPDAPRPETRRGSRCQWLSSDLCRVRAPTASSTFLMRFIAHVQLERHTWTRVQRCTSQNPRRPGPHDTRVSSRGCTPTRVRAVCAGV